MTRPIIVAFLSLVLAGAGGGVSISNPPTGTVSVAFSLPDGGLLAAQGVNNTDAGTAWEVYVVNPSSVSFTIPDGGLTVSQGGVWNVGLTADAGVRVTNMPSSIVVSNFDGGVTSYQGGDWSVQLVADAGVHVSNFPSSFVVSNYDGGVTAYQGGSWGMTLIDAGVTVLNFPSSFSMSNYVPPDGGVTAFQGGSWAVQLVADAGVHVDNFPTSFIMSNYDGGVTAYQGGVWACGITEDAGVKVTNWPASFAVSNYDGGVVASQGGDWTVNLAIDAGVHVTNWPTSFTMSNYVPPDGGVTAFQGGVWACGITADAGVNVNNWPASFSVSNFDGNVTAKQGLNGSDGGSAWNVFVVNPMTVSLAADSGFVVTFPSSMVVSNFDGGVVASQGGVWAVGITADAGVNVNNFPTTIGQGLNGSDGGNAWDVYVVNQSSSSVSFPDAGLTVTQGGDWYVGLVDAGVSVLNWPSSFTMSNYIPPDGGVTAFQGGSPWGMTLIDAGVTVLNFPSSFTMSNYVPPDGGVTAFQGGVWACGITEDAGVNVNNWPATYTAKQGLNGSDGGGAWDVYVVNPMTVSLAADSGFNVTFPSSMVVSNFDGGVVASQGGNWGVTLIDAGVTVLNFPSSFSMSNYVPPDGGVTAFQGGAPWSVLLADAGVVATQGGTWSVFVANYDGGVNVNNWPSSFSMSNYVPPDGGVIAFQGGAPWSMLLADAGVHVLNFPSSFTMSNYVPPDGGVTAFQGNAPWVVRLEADAGVHVDNFPTSFAINNANDGGIAVNTAMTRGSRVTAYSISFSACTALSLIPQSKSTAVQNQSTTAEIWCGVDSTCVIGGASILVPARTATALSGAPGWVGLDIGGGAATWSCRANGTGDAGIVVIEGW